jgi:hypothetical protein
MWIVIRLILTLVVALTRVHQRLNPQQRAEAGQLNSTPYFLELNHDKHGAITGFELGIPLPTQCLFKFQTEGMFDGFSKSLGLSTEFQTGDGNFDKKIYLACDYPVLLQQLADSSQSREIILELLGRRMFNSIWSDGSILWTSTASDKEPSEHVIQRMQQLAATLQPLCQTAAPQKRPFFWRFLWVEALVWSLFGYAASSMLEKSFGHHDYHLYYSDIVKYGLLTAAVLLVILMLIIRLVLGKSSLGHTILAESFFVLLLALPLSGMQLVSDVNRYFDNTEAQQIEALIGSAYTQSKRGRKKYLISYHLQLQSPPMLFNRQVPENIEVTEDLYNVAANGKLLQLRVKPGFLGLPWYEQMVIHKPDPKLLPKD